MSLLDHELAKLSIIDLNVVVLGGAPTVAAAALDVLHDFAAAEDRHRRNTETGCYRSAGAARGEAWIRAVFPQRPSL